MKAKNILMIYLFISGLFCLPSKAQQPGENVSSQTIRKLGAEFVGLSEKNISVRLTRIREKMKQYLIEREVFV